jgi:type II secretory pathway component GspD/PulD (secretin)
MYSQIAGLALTLSLALCTEVRAQGKAAPKDAKPAPTLEQRLALLEEQAAKMLAEIKAIRGQIKESTPNREDLKNFTIYRLKNIDANQMAKLLSELLDLPRGNKTVRVVADSQTNSIIVAGKEEDHEIIRAIIVRLDESGADAAPAKKDKR